MSAREGPAAALKRWQRLELLQQAYPTFQPFLHDMMEELGFHTDEIQDDIADWIENGPNYLMVQAQRGQAKTTITAIFTIWCLIHAPKLRILIASAGGTQANEISTLIVRMIQTVDILEPLRPDPTQGDRTSVEHFDVHYSLKGVDKSPSVASMGVSGNLQGKRADLLIADDVESQKNSMTALMREQLLHITKDFVSINSTGRIIYLGTPQSVESIYNTLPGRGFAVRIWPGRYPTKVQIEHYGDALAPLILKRVLADPSLSMGYGLDGQQGAATSPRIIPEDILVAKELDQGPAYFQLQHMLLTALSDALRFPLKTTALTVMRLGTGAYPMTVTRGFGATKEWSINGQRYRASPPHAVSAETGRLTSSCLYFDPAGGGLNADETGWAFGGLLNSNIYLEASGGIPGGYDQNQLQAVADLVLKYKPTVVKIEKNLGFGAFRAVVTPVIKAAVEKAQKEGWDGQMPGMADDLVTGQKELRIIATLEPVMGRGALIVNEAIFENEADSLQRYDMRVRNTYSLFFQMAKLTRDRHSLIHDDRLDALEGLVRHYADALAVDQKKAIEAANKREYEEIMRNPLNLPRSALGPTSGSQNLFSRRVRKL